MIALLFALLSTSSMAGSPPVVEPINPDSLCERFLKESDQAACLKKTKKMDLDWYAVSVCNRIEDDDVFMDCLKKIDGKGYAPAALASCAGEDVKDEARTGCLMKIGTLESKRAPASGAKPSAKPVYQPLKIGK